MAYQDWTTGQDDLLREMGYRGVDYCRSELLRRFGVVRTEAAVQMHASRIHVSLAARSVCPECGAVGTHLNQRTGMCPTCTERMHVEEERAFNALLEAERIDKEDGPELERLRNEYDMLRQRNSRLCRKYGLAGKRERNKQIRTEGSGEESR